jgi:hypothetical protein
MRLLTAPTDRYLSSRERHTSAASGGSRRVCGSASTAPGFPRLHLMKEAQHRRNRSDRLRCSARLWRRCPSGAEQRSNQPNPRCQRSLLVRVRRQARVPGTTMRIPATSADCDPVRSPRQRRLSDTDPRPAEPGRLSWDTSDMPSRGEVRRDTDFLRRRARPRPPASRSPLAVSRETAPLPPTSS